MQDSYELSSVMVVRRKAKKLPSLTRNIIRALLLLFIIPVLVFAVLEFTGNPDDAVATGEVSLDPVPLPPASDTLGGSTDALPDLLQGVVPEDTNPTELLDALGNPIGPSDKPPSDLAGGNDGSVPETIIPQPAISGPKTILIDGQPLDGTLVFSASPLPRAPIAGLTRPSPFGQVPKIGSDGKKPVDAYARPFTLPAGKNPVSLIVGGLGIDRNLTRRMINELPPEVTLSFAAHANGLQTWINRARAQGHEVLIELPMESAGFDPNAPNATHSLRTGVDAARNIRNLDWLMSRAQGYFAVTNYNGDILLQRADAIGPILAHLSDSGVGFIFDGSAQAPSLPTLAKSADLPLKSAYNLLDVDTGSQAINAELARLKAQALTGQTPIGVGFAYPQTLDALKSWIALLDSDDLVLAPVSYGLSR